MASLLARIAFYLGWVALLAGTGMALRFMLEALGPCGPGGECKPGLGVLFGGVWAALGFGLWGLLILPYEIQRRRRRRAE